MRRMLIQKNVFGNLAKIMLANHTLHSFEGTRALFEDSIQDKMFDYKIPEFVLR